MIKKYKICSFLIAQAVLYMYNVRMIVLNETKKKQPREKTLRAGLVCDGGGAGADSGLLNRGLGVQFPPPPHFLNIPNYIYVVI